MKRNTGRGVKVCPMTLSTFCTIHWLVQLRLDGTKASKSKNCHLLLKKGMAGCMNMWPRPGNSPVLLQKWVVLTSTNSGLGKLQRGKIMFLLKTPLPCLRIRCHSCSHIANIKKQIGKLYARFTIAPDPMNCAAPVTHAPLYQ